MKEPDFFMWKWKRDGTVYKFGHQTTNTFYVKAIIFKESPRSFRLQINGAIHYFKKLTPAKEVTHLILDK